MPKLHLKWYLWLEMYERGCSSCSGFLWKSIIFKKQKRSVHRQWKLYHLTLDQQVSWKYIEAFYNNCWIRTDLAEFLHFIFVKMAISKIDKGMEPWKYFQSRMHNWQRFRDLAFVSEKLDFVSFAWYLKDFLVTYPSRRGPCWQISDISCC